MKGMIKVLGAFCVASCLWGGFKTEVKADSLIEIRQTACATDAATVSWGSVEGADHYECTISDGTTENATEEVSGTEYTVSNLLAGASYQLVVNAYQGEELLAKSDVFEVVTMPDISNYTVTQSGAAETYVKISMANAVGANYYIVKKTGTNGEQVASGTSNKIKVKSLKANKKYTYKVYAVRKSSSGFYAYTSKSYKKVTVRTINEAVSDTKFDVTGMNFEDDQYTFGVKGSYKADGYELQILTMAGKEKKKFTSDGFKNVVVEDIIKGHFYKYRVRTYINCGDTKAYSKWSKKKYIGVGEDAYGYISLKKIRITWKKVVDATGYEVSVSLNGKNYNTIKTVSASSARKVVLTRVGGYRIRLKRRYYFRIRPISKDGKKTIKSEYTNDVSVLLK